MAAEFFLMILNWDVPRLAVENPVMHGYALEIIGRRSDFSVQPYEHGHSDKKRTCFWTKGLPALKPTNVVPKPEHSKLHRLGYSKDRSKLRSITFTGIAEAMADQWGGLTVE